MTTGNSRISSRPTRLPQAGFTLVEIMVGLAIGLLATLVIMQVFSAFETQTKATTGSADAQTNGSIALYNISRELQQAGYPLTPATDSPLQCTTLTYGATGVTSISPVTITNGVATTGVNASDSITIRYGTSSGGGIPSTITGVGAPTANDVTVDSSLGCNTGDNALITNGTTCAMTSITGVTSAVPATLTLQNTTNATAGASVACLGTWNEVTYAVNNGTLERNGAPTIAGIVNLQAQYGISSSATSNQVTQWVDATGSWAAPTVADRNRIKAIRIAIIARNTKREVATTTSTCSSTIAASPSGLCAWAGSTSSPAPTVDLSNADSNWQHYHYRVFETIIPLRNVIWSKDKL